VDEHKLAELFRDAVRDAPPPSFDEGDVRSASHRATARRRSALALGSTMAVVLVFGGIAVGAGVFGGGSKSLDAATAGSAEGSNSSPGETMTPYGLPADPNAEQKATDRGGPPPKSVPEDSSTQGDETPGSASLSAGSTPTGCGPVDRELAIALAGELPVAAGTQPSPAAGTCPAGSKGAGYLVRDGDVIGVFSVVVVPKGALQATGLGSAAAKQVSRTAQSGATVHVVSEPEQGSGTAPFAGKLDSVATDLASRY
jgi:hypothetical protein